MHVTFEDSLDLGIVLTSLVTEAVNRDEVSRWASRAIDELDDPPTYIYSMLDLDHYDGPGLRREINFNPYNGLESEEEYQYLREIAVRRGLKNIKYLSGKPRTALNTERESFINDLLRRNFGIDVKNLPSLASHSSE